MKKFKKFNYFLSKIFKKILINLVLQINKYLYQIINSKSKHHMKIMKLQIFMKKVKIKLKNFKYIQMNNIMILKI